MNASYVQPLLLDLSEAGEVLRCSRYVIGKLIESGELPAVRVGSRQRVTYASLEAFVARQQMNDTPQGHKCQICNAQIAPTGRRGRPRSTCTACDARAAVKGVVA